MMRWSHNLDQVVLIQCIDLGLVVSYYHVLPDRQEMCKDHLKSTLESTLTCLYQISEGSQEVFLESPSKKIKNYKVGYMRTLETSGISITSSHSLYPSYPVYFHIELVCSISQRYSSRFVSRMK